MNKKVAVSKEITPQQEQAALMLAGGKSVMSVANELDVNRNTIYKWQTQKPFIEYYNTQCQLFKEKMRNEIFELAVDALKGIKESVHSKSESIRLKASIWVCDKIIGALTMAEFDSEPKQMFKTMDEVLEELRSGNTQKGEIIMDDIIEALS